MIITKQFLSDYLPAIATFADSKIAAGLEQLGYEIKAITNYRQANTNLIAGKVLTKVLIPKSDHLNLVTVDLGNQKPATIVCGADNYQPGDLVLVAQPGAKLANGLKIRTRSVFQIMSQGMICSWKELGFNFLDAEEGIIVLPPTIPVGHPDPLSWLKLADTAFELELTYNRDYAWSAYNLMQELAQVFNLKVNHQPLSPVSVLSGSSPTDLVKVQGETDYAVQQLVIDGKVDQTSPTWLQSCLRLINVKPVNLWADLSAYLTWETGQPLLLLNGDLGPWALEQVKPALRKKHPELADGDFVLCQNQTTYYSLTKPLSSALWPSAQTKTVIALTVMLPPALVRRQAALQPTTTVFLQRWMRNQFSSRLTWPQARLKTLLSALALKVTAVDKMIGHQSHPTIKPITLSLAQLKASLAIDVTMPAVINLFTNLGFTIKAHDATTVTVVCPTWRTDLSLPINLVAEFARFYGYDHLPTQPWSAPIYQPPANLGLIATSKQILVNYGFCEALTYSLVDSDDLKTYNHFNYEAPIVVQVPLTTAQTVMRFSLLPSLLQAASYNNARKQPVNLVETSQIYASGVNQEHLGIVCQQPLLANTYQAIAALNPTFATLKGLILAIIGLTPIKLQQLSFKRSDLPWLHPQQQAAVYYQHHYLGIIGQLHPSTIDKLNLTVPTWVAELRLDLLNNSGAKTTAQFQPYPSWPAITRDLSLKLDAATDYQGLSKELYHLSPLLTKIDLIDIYADPAWPASVVSWTLRFTFNSQHQQLTDEAVDLIISKIKTLLRSKKIIIRD